MPPPGYDPGLYGEFQTIATAASLPPEAARQVLALHERAVKAGQVAHVEATTKLAEAARADPELSTDFDANIRLANEALVRLGATSDLLHALQTSGLGNHKDLIKLLVRVGREL